MDTNSQRWTIADVESFPAACQVAYSSVIAELQTATGCTRDDVEVTPLEYVGDDTWSVTGHGPGDHRHTVLLVCGWRREERATPAGCRWATAHE